MTTAVEGVPRNWRKLRRGTDTMTLTLVRTWYRPIGRRVITFWGCGDRMFTGRGAHMKALAQARLAWAAGAQRA